MDECTCRNCGGREHCKNRFEPSRKCCCFWEPELKPIWIPCSERMPENCTKVLVWFEYFRYGEYNCMYSTWGIGEYFDFSGRWLIDDSTGWQDLHVFAWMPLPDPPEVNENA